MAVLRAEHEPEIVGVLAPRTAPENGEATATTGATVSIVKSRPGVAPVWPSVSVCEATTVYGPSDRAAGTSTLHRFASQVAESVLAAVPVIETVTAPAPVVQSPLIVGVAFAT